MKKLFVLFLFLISTILFANPSQNLSTKFPEIDFISFKNQQHLFLGYTTNLPSQFLGFSIFSSNPKSIGFYFDMKGPFAFRSSSDYYYDNISINKAENIFGDDKVSTDEDWLTIDIGITKTIAKGALLFTGIGYTDHNCYNQYYDEYEILGKNGKYWIDNKEKSESKINLFGGCFFVLNDKIVIQAGASTFPSSATLGCGFLIF